MLGWDDEMTQETIDALAGHCYSRIPVYYGDMDRKFIVGVLMLKSLVRFSFNPDEIKTIGELAMSGQVEIRDPIYVSKDAAIFIIMREF
jgi:Mg2+/Co2+ transporter CorB